MSTPSFNEWVQREGHAPNGKWVVARRTKRTLARYPDSTFFSPKRYADLVELHRILVRGDVVTRLWFDNGSPIGVFDLLVEVFELGRKAQ